MTILKSADLEKDYRTFISGEFFWRKCKFQGSDIFGHKYEVEHVINGTKSTMKC